MKILLIDAGNTRLKWTSMDERDFSVHLSNKKSNKKTNQEAISYGKNMPIDCYADLIEAEANKHKQVVLVSVQGNDFAKQAEKITSKAGLDFFNVISQRQLGKFKNAYKIPEQLGADRFVALLAAYEIATKNKPKPCIVIDCGTAVTIDAIDANGQHLGGLILPGLEVCSNSLLKNTQQIFSKQSSDPEQLFDLLTNNTSDAIISGSFYGLSSAIKETCFKIEKQIISQHLQPHSQQQLQAQSSVEVVKIICGGDAEVLLPQLPADFLIYPDLVMQGAKLVARADV